MTKYLVQKIIGLGLILAHAVVSAQALSACAAVYSTAVANTSESSRTRVNQQQTFDKYCEINGSSRSRNSGLDLTIPVQGIVVGFQGSQSDAQQQMKNFCKQFISNSLSIDNQYSYDKHVVVAALNSFNECIAMEQNGVRMSNAISYPTGIVISADFGLDRIVRVRNALYDTNSGQCYFAGTPIAGKRDVIIPGRTSTRIFKKPFSIACVRKVAATIDGTKKYSSFRVVLDTSAGRYTAELPADDVQDWESASATKARFAQLELDRANIIAQRDGLESKIKNFSMEIRSVTQTDSPNALSSSNERVGCKKHGNDLDAYIAGMCGNGKVARKQVIKTNSEGECGTTLFAYTCSSF